MGKKNNIGNSALFLVLIFAVLAISAFILFFSLRTDPVEEVLKNDQLLKILFVLSDEDSVISTDVILYYPVTQRTAMFDIPGRTGAIYSSVGRVDRIDSVYLEKGIQSYKQEIEKLLDTTIPFTLEINLDQFSQLTDLLGGLRIFIPSPVDIKTETDYFLLPSGSVTLDGDKIKTYIKYREEGETEFDIQERMQNTVLGFLNALHEKKDLVLGDRTFEYFTKLLKTDMDKDGLKSLLSEITNIDSERLSPQTITGSIRDVDGKQLLFPYYDGQLIKDACKQSMSALVASTNMVFDRTYVLEIQNGTTVQGLAKNTAALLQSIGYDVLTTTNADSNNYDKTIIIDHINNSQVASSLGEFIMCENIVVDEVQSEDAGLDANLLVDFTIILGKDFDGRYVRD
ncbi:MAG: LytR family transcriptional regulator [Spirochaetaceae bacterium]|nr:LytR family transcriptional regulator [Spirochaetaceae bacterium]